MQGVLLTIPISADAAAKGGTNEGKLKNIQFGTKDGRTLYLKEVSFSITVNTQGGDIPSGDRLIVEDISASQGATLNLDIQFEFETDNFTGYQFDLVLPDGLNVVLDEEGVYYKSHNVSASHLSSCDRFVCLSTSSMVFKKKNGILLTIPLSVDTAVKNGALEGKLKSIQLGTQNGSTIYFEDVPFSIVIGENSPVGDINYDGLITIADVMALVNIILGKDDVEPYVYNHKAADVNGDGSITIADVTALVNIILGK